MTDLLSFAKEGWHGIYLNNMQYLNAVPGWLILILVKIR
jgi:hypothetical protein